MIRVNSKDSFSDINSILEKDFDMFDNVVSCKLSPFTRKIMDIELNPNYETMYNFATEDISSYIGKFSSLNSYLSVCASGDQILNGILYGATNIDTFDKNFFSKHILFLKLSAIKALKPHEFIKFFTEYDLKLFEKILQESEIYIQKFWEKVFSEYNIEVVIKLIFDNLKLSIEQIKQINPYLDPANYEKLIELIKRADVNFIESDLHELPRYIFGKSYDAINLSNIYEHLYYRKPIILGNSEEFRDFIINKLYPCLNTNGTILIAYLYAWSEKVKADFDEMYKKYKGQLAPAHALSNEYLPLLQLGLTTQNLLYSYLFEAFKDLETTKIQTAHVEFGHSKDTSHDLALLLTKNKDSCLLSLF